MALKSLKKPIASTEEEAPAVKKTLGLKKKTLSVETRGEEEAEPKKKLGLTKAAEEDAPPKKTLALKKAAPAEEIEEEEEEAEVSTDLGLFDRTALKVIIKEEGVPIVVNKGMTDDDLRAAIIANRPEVEEVEAEVEPEEEEAEPEPPKAKKGLKKAKKIDPEVEHVVEEIESDGSAEDTDDRQLAKVESVVPVYALGQVSGEIDESLLSRPRIEFVQSVGPLVEEHEFTAGQIVVNKEVLVWEKGYDPLNLIVVSAFMRFVEDTEFGSEEIPRRFASAAEAREAGLTTTWVDHQPPQVFSEMCVLALLQQPDYIEPHPAFDLELPGTDLPWILAEMSLKKGSLRDKKAGSYLLTLQRSTLKKGLHLGMLGLTCERVKGEKNTTTIPRFKLLGETPKEVVKGIESVLADGV